jgi:hypothetical protein
MTAAERRLVPSEVRKRLPWRVSRALTDTRIPNSIFGLHWNFGLHYAYPTGRRYAVESEKTKAIESKMRFANKVCKDTNTYTAEKEFWDIVKTGSDGLLQKEEYVRSAFPALNWK